MHICFHVYTSAKCEGGEGVEGEVVKVTDGDQSLCPASLNACRTHSNIVYRGFDPSNHWTLILAMC